MSEIQPITSLSEKVVALAASTNTIIATAESCTGGLIGGALTDIAGSSAIFDRGFITYSNSAKCELLSVPQTLIDTHGAVSGEVAASMASGALEKSSAHLTVAVTGIAGPGGGTDEKPVGLVWFGIAHKSNIHTEAKLFEDHGRASIRLETVHHALKLLLDRF